MLTRTLDEVGRLSVKPRGEANARGGVVIRCKSGERDECLVGKRGTTDF